MKRIALNLNNPSLLAIAKWATRRGEKLAKLTKHAADSTTVAYWSDYFKQYGTMFVRPLALQKSAKVDDRTLGERVAQLIPPGSTLDVKGEKMKVNNVTEAGGSASYSLTKADGTAVEMTDQQLNELDATLEQKVASLGKVAAQITYDVPVKVVVSPDAELAPDAFEHSLKFALEALKPASAVHVSVDHVFVDMEEGTDMISGEQKGRMIGYAKCAVAFEDGEMNESEFKLSVESQLKKFLGEASFPPLSVSVEAVTKRMPKSNAGDIMEDARQGHSLARLTASYGLHASRIARDCAVKEAAGFAFDAKLHMQAKATLRLAQSSMEPLEFVGDAASTAGTKATLPDGSTAKIHYAGKVEDSEFKWSVQGSDGSEKANGGADTWDEAVKEIEAAMPQVQHAAAKVAVMERLAIVREVGPIVSMEKLASLGDIGEFRIQTKSDKTVWLTMQAGKVTDKVGF